MLDGFKTFIIEGGWGMFPTMIFGAFLVGGSVLYLIRPEKKAVLPVLLCFAALVLGSGVLGTTMGLINTLHYVTKDGVEERMRIFGVGTAESLNNMVLAFILLVKGMLLTTVGVVRQAMRSPAA
jgi:hypothetical protein